MPTSGHGELRGSHVATRADELRGRLRQPLRQRRPNSPAPAPAASRPPASARTAAAAAASPPAPESGPPCGGCPPRTTRRCSARCPAPPCARGTTWSTVVARRPQYAHRCRSRTSTPRLDHGACLRNGTRTYRQSLITRGTGMSTAAPRIRSPGWACSTTALSCSTRTTARFNVTVDSGSKLAFSTSVSRIPPTSVRTGPPRGGLDQLWPGTPRWTTQ